MADACVFVMEKNAKESLLNIGTGVDISIYDLAKLIVNTVDFKGKITFDSSKPDGTLRKLLNVERMEYLGWRSKVSLLDGIMLTYSNFKAVL